MDTGWSVPWPPHVVHHYSSVESVLASVSIESVLASYSIEPVLASRAPERWELWKRVPSQFDILAATFG